MRHFFILCWFICPLWALDLQTSIVPIGNASTPSRAGVLTIEVNSNDFPVASVNNPIYLKFTLPVNFELANTLATPATPVNLNVYFLSSLLGDTLTLPPDGVRLIRFIAGESSFYIEIRKPTETWIDNSGVFDPPTANRRVAFTMGVSQAASMSLGGAGNSADTPILIRKVNPPIIDRAVTLNMAAYGPNTDPNTPSDGELWPVTVNGPAVIAQITNPILLFKE